jgi:hypothetical protein
VREGYRQGQSSLQISHAHRGVDEYTVIIDDPVTGSSLLRSRDEFEHLLRKAEQQMYSSIPDNRKAAGQSLREAAERTHESRLTSGRGRRFRQVRTIFSPRDAAHSSASSGVSSEAFRRRPLGTALWSATSTAAPPRHLRVVEPQPAGREDLQPHADAVEVTRRGNLSICQAAPV